MCKSLNKDNEFYHYLHNRNNCEWGQFVDLENENITKDKKYIQITQRLEYIYNNKKQYTQFSTPLYIRKDQNNYQYKDQNNYQYNDQNNYQYNDQYNPQYKYPRHKYQYNNENDHQKYKDQYNKENKYIINTVNIQNIQINNNNNVIEIIFQILNTVINYFCKEK
jgi:hypothetical protein